MSGTKLQDQLSHIIASVNRQLEEELAERLRPECIPLEQMRILEFIAKEGRGCAMREIAHAVLVDPPTLTRIVDRMVSSNLVYRAPSLTDRRVVLVHLAPDGATLHERITTIFSAQESRLSRQLAGNKAEELRELLRQLMSM